MIELLLGIVGYVFKGGFDLVGNYDE